MVTERREVVVGSVLQPHQLQQYLRSAGIDDFSVDGTTFRITAEPEQWAGIDQWLKRIGVQWETPPENRNTQWDDLRIERQVELEEAAEASPATTLVDTGSFFVRVPKEES